MNTIDLTPILQAVIALQASWITLRVIPWIRSKTTREQQEYLLSATRVLVYAAEQLYGAGQGAKKFQYVHDELENRGLNVDIAAIEAAVREMNLIESWETEIELEDIEDGGEE